MFTKSEESKLKRALTTFLESPVSESSYQELSQSITFQNLILALNNEDISLETSQQIIKVIEKCFNFRQLRHDILSNEQMQEIIVNAAKNSTKEISSLIAKALEMTSREADGLGIFQSDKILSVLVTLITSEHLEVFQSIENAVLRIIKNENTTFNKIFNHPDIQKIIISINSFDEIIKIRLLSLFVSMGKISPEIFDSIEEKGIYKRVIQLFLDKDIIIQMNSIELVNQMISFPKGLDFLCQDEFPNRYLRELKLNDFEPVVSCLLQFLSEAIEKYPHLSTKIFEDESRIFILKLREYYNMGLPMRDGNKLACFIVCWSHINTNSLGYHYLHNSISTANTIMTDLISGNKGREISITALSAWVKVLNSNPEVISLFKQVVENELIEKIMKHLTVDPFKEMRGVSYHLLQLIVKSYPVSVEIFFNSKEHRNLLINSTTDSDSKVKYAKYDFVKASMANYRVLIEDIAGRGYARILDEYIKSGPYYQFKGLNTSIKDISL